MMEYNEYFDRVHGQKLDAVTGITNSFLEKWADADDAINKS